MRDLPGREFGRASKLSVPADVPSPRAGARGGRCYPPDRGDDVCRGNVGAFPRRVQNRARGDHGFPPGRPFGRVRCASISVEQGRGGNRKTRILRARLRPAWGQPERCMANPGLAYGEATQGRRGHRIVVVRDRKAIKGGTPRGRGGG